METQSIPSSPSIKKWIAYVAFALVVLGVLYYYGMQLQQKESLQNAAPGSGATTVGTPQNAEKQAAEAVNPFKEETVNPFENTTANPFDTTNINPFE